jgi:hypothetical protein
MGPAVMDGVKIILSTLALSVTFWTEEDTSYTTTVSFDAKRMF